MKLSDNLKSLILDSVTLGWGATGFSFSGKKEGEYFRYELSTMFEICFSNEEIFKTDILEHPSTIKLWGYLNKKLLDIVLSDDGRVCELKFEGEKSIYVWSKEFDHDNLLIVNSYDSDEWFAIG